MSESATMTKKRVRRPLTYALGRLDTVTDTDADGAEVTRQCIVLLDMPPGLTDSQTRNRDAIKRAVRKAVYDEGLEQFGNQELVVVTFDNSFEAPFEKRTETKLVPPGS